MLHDIDAIIHAAISERIFPGAALIIAQHGHPLHAAAHGTTMYDDDGSQPVTLNTIYDLASLTKVFTATAALRLHDAGLLSLDEPIQRWLPAVRASGITARHLLSHRSGLAVQLAPLARHHSNLIRQTVYQAAPTHPPGSMTSYANLNTLLLGDLVEVAYGGPLDRAIDELVCAPLGMRHTRFCPPAEWKARIAPTEWDHTWRGMLVHGIVHDESAWALGGVAGHAGLFGLADEVIRLVQLFLQEGSWMGQQLIRAATVAAAIRAQPGALDHERHPVSGLGWMMRRPFMGPAQTIAFGHSGFTGPLMIGIPGAGLAIVLLCNRTYPQRLPPPYRHHAVMAELIARVL